MRGKKYGGRVKGTPNKMTALTADVKALASAFTKQAIDVLSTLLVAESMPPGIRIMAAKELLDRACGKPAQALVGPEGGPIQMKQIIHQQLRDDDE